MPINNPINDPQHSSNTNDPLVKILEMTIEDSHSLMVHVVIGALTVVRGGHARGDGFP